MNPPGPIERSIVCGSRSDAGCGVGGSEGRAGSTAAGLASALGSAGLAVGAGAGFGAAALGAVREALAPYATPTGVLLKGAIWVVEAVRV